MQIVATIGADLALLFTMLFSAQIASGWGELCGIRPGRDKSGLGGFAAMYVLFVIRWTALALGLVVFGNDGERLLLLGGHTALGLASVVLFEHGCKRVRNDRMVPNALGVLGGVLVPTPAVALVAARGNSIWAGDSHGALAAFVIAVAAVNCACYSIRRRDMLRTERAQPAATH